MRVRVDRDVALGRGPVGGKGPGESGASKGECCHKTAGKRQPRDVVSGFHLNSFI